MANRRYCGTVLAMNITSEERTKKSLREPIPVSKTSSHFPPLYARGNPFVFHTHEGERQAPAEPQQ